MERSLAPDRLATLVGDFPRAPAYLGLRQALQELIGDGRIPLGTRLPSERAVTAALGVSRNTVARAYADLVAAGFATARQGAGTYAAVPLDRRRAHDHALHAAVDSAAASKDIVDLNCAASGAVPGIAAAYARALDSLPAYLASDGYLPSGLPALRALIADHYVQRGLPTATEQIVITSGALSAIAIIARTLTRPGERVMIESPVYSNAIDALRLGGARLVSAPMADALGDDGWDLAGIEATLRQTSPRVAYLIPDFQNPTGFLMRDAQRVRYAALLRDARTTAIVDETLQSTCLSDAPMPAPFASHAPDAFTVGSASKRCWGGLRVGWIRAPHDAVDRLIATRVRMDLGSSLFDQLVVAEMLAAVDVIAVRRQQLRQRRDALADALREHLPDWRFRLPDGGLSLWVRMPQGSATQLATAVERRGVYLAPGPVFSVEGGADNWLRIPYAKPEEQLVQAVRTMAETWTQLPHRPAARGGDAKRLIA